MKQGQRCKILLLGQSSVGKTTLFKRYIGEQIDRVTPTIGIEYKQKIIQQNNGKIMKVQLWDTAGTQRYKTITPIYYRNVDGVLIIFDITNKSSFRSIQYWVDQLNQKGEDQANLILVGNKNDQQQEREVTQEEAKTKADQLGIKYIETNAFDVKDAKVPFQALIQAIINRRKRLSQTMENTKMKQSTTIKLSELSRRQNKSECC